jgi:hypothetical protein
MKVDMIVVPQSYWAHLEVLWLNTYVPAKTLTAMKISRLSFGATPLTVAAGHSSMIQGFTHLGLEESNPTVGSAAPCLQSGYHSN